MKQITKKELNKKKPTKEQGHWESKHWCNCKTRNYRRWLAKRKYGNPISDDFDEVLKNIPKVVLNSLPSDAATQADHYIYGCPKTSVSQ